MGKIITFAQQKGGAGKTTVLIHLAEAWAAAGRDVAIVDLDPQATLSRWHGLSNSPLTPVETKDYRASADLKAAAKDHDLVLVDCPGSASSMLEAALRASDLMIAPCQPSPMDVWAVESIHNMAAREKTPMLAVLNRVPPRGGSVEETAAALKALGIATARARLGNRVAFSNAIGAGRSAISGRKSTAAEEVAALAKEVAKQIGLKR